VESIAADLKAVRELLKVRPCSGCAVKRLPFLNLPARARARRERSQARDLRVTQATSYAEFEAALAGERRFAELAEDARRLIFDDVRRRSRCFAVLATHPEANPFPFADS